MDNKHDKQTRREFFATLGRWGALGALAAGVAVAWRHTARPGDHACVNANVCGPCRLFEECRLPAALSAKQATQKDQPSS